ncbi:MAG: diguanylate cyclase domain-containing protein, partial [Candidatus Saccharicenans sp.]
GDEFTILLGELSSVETGIQVAERIVQAFNLPLNIADKKIIVRASLGLAIFPDQAREPEELLKKADLALYEAKEAGRNQARIYSD